MLAHMGQKGPDHPAYSRAAESAPPYVRVKTLVACSPLGDNPGSHELRARFLALLARASILELIGELIVIRPDVSWKPRGTGRRSILKADLTGEDPQEAPVASAMMELPDAGMRRFGTDPRCAELMLHVDLVLSSELVITFGEGQESRPVIPGLPAWRRRVTRALSLPGELANFLEDLGLATSGDPPAQIGVLLQARDATTEIVNPGGIKSLPAPYIVNEYSGYAIADPDGKTADEMAGRIVLDLSERVLHLDGPEAELSGEIPAADELLADGGHVEDTWTS